MEGLCGDRLEARIEATVAVFLSGDGLFKTDAHSQHSRPHGHVPHMNYNGGLMISTASPQIQR